MLLSTPPPLLPPSHTRAHSDTHLTHTHEHINYLLGKLLNCLKFSLCKSAWLLFSVHLDKGGESKGYFPGWRHNVFHSPENLWTFHIVRKRSSLERLRHCFWSNRCDTSKLKEDDEVAGLWCPSWSPCKRERAFPRAFPSFPCRNCAGHWTWKQ